MLEVLQRFKTLGDRLVAAWAENHVSTPLSGLPAAIEAFDTGEYDAKFNAVAQYITPAVRDAFTRRLIDNYAIESTVSTYGSSTFYNNVDLFYAPTKPCASTLYRCFRGCSNLMVLAKIDTTGVTSLDQTFYSCISFKEVDVSEWDVSSVTTLNQTFYNCKSLDNLDVSKWDTSSVTNMSATFDGCVSLTSLDVTGWDTSNVTTMNGMFRNCDLLTSLDMSGWNTSSVTDMASLFSGCHSLTTLDLTGWDTSSVTAMNSMFANCVSLTSNDFMSSWSPITQDVTISGMFAQCASLETLDLSMFHGSSPISSLCYACTSLKTLDISNLDTSQSTSFFRAFDSCYALQTITGTIDGSGVLLWMTSAQSNNYATHAQYHFLHTYQLTDVRFAENTWHQRLYFGSSSRLSDDSILSILKGLYDWTADDVKYYAEQNPDADIEQYMEDNGIYLVTQVPTHDSWMGRLMTTGMTYDYHDNPDDMVSRKAVFHNTVTNKLNTWLETYLAEMESGTSSLTQTQQDIAVEIMNAIAKGWTINGLNI